MVRGLSRKKKVLLLVRWPVGGIRTFIRYVYCGLDLHDWQLTILAPDLPEMQALIEDLTGLGVRYILTAANPSPVMFAVRVFRELATAKYDLIHSHGFSSGISAALPAFLTRTSHLLTSHDVINEKQFIGVKGFLKKLIMGLAFRMIDCIHSVSYDAQVNLSFFFPELVHRNGKAIVILNGIETEYFNGVFPRDLRSELGLSGEVFLIGFLGRFMAQKGFRYLVEAISLLHSEASMPKQVLVLTFGEGNFIREEKQTIREMGLSEYFRFMPFASSVAGIIKGLDVIVMPSLWEACPLQPMEALVCGTPLIATDCIGLREVVLDTPAKLVPVADAAALAQALRSEMVDCSKDTFLAFTSAAVKRFDVSTTRNHIFDLYKKLINRSCL